MGGAQERGKSSFKTAWMVKAIRVELNLSQEDLGCDLGVNFATVNRWENDKVTPSRLVKFHLESFCKKRNIQNTMLN